MTTYRIDDEDKTLAVQGAVRHFMADAPDFELNEETARFLTDFVCDNSLSPFDPASYRMAHESLKSIREERKHYAMSSADYRKTVLNPDFKSRQPAPRSPRVFTPAKAYTPAEIDRMSSAEYKAAVMGILDHASGESQVLATPDRSGQRKRSSSLRGLKRAGIE